MADKAKERIQAIGQQLEPVKKLAPGSSTLRVKDKVIVITGIFTLKELYSRRC